MLQLADFSSFLGSIWFSLLVGVVGYAAGSIFPFSALASVFRRSK